MYFRQIIDEIGDSLNDTCAKWAGDNASRVKEAVNEFLFLDFLPLLDWNFNDKESVISTLAEYATGTVSTTLGSTTITGFGTTFTSAMVGYRIMIEGAVRSYKITAYSSATSITIESGFEQVSLSGVSYHICKDRYNLPRWVDEPGKIAKITARWNGFPLKQLSKQDLERIYPTRAKVDDPFAYCIGLRERTTYSTGTLSGTSGAFTLTGVSTAWLSSGLEQFDFIAVGDYVYTISSINSDTSITTVEALVATITAGTVYTATLDRYKIDFYPLPKNVRGYALTASMLLPRLVNSYDVPQLPDNWHYLLVKGGRVKMLKHNQDSNYAAEQAELTAVLRRLISNNQRERDRIEVITTA